MLLAAQFFVLLKENAAWECCRAMVKCYMYNMFVISFHVLKFSLVFPLFSVLLLIPSFPWLCFGALCFWDYPFSDFPVLTVAFSAILLPVVSYVLRHNKQLMPNTDRGLNHKIAETFNVSEAPINTE